MLRVMRQSLSIFELDLWLQWEHSAILLIFIKLPFDTKIFVLSIFEWPFYTCFTVLTKALQSSLFLLVPSSVGGLCLVLFCVRQKKNVSLLFDENFKQGR